MYISAILNHQHAPLPTKQLPFNSWAVSRMTSMALEMFTSSPCTGENEDVCWARCLGEMIGLHRCEVWKTEVFDMQCPTYLFVLYEIILCICVFVKCVDVKFNYVYKKNPERQQITCLISKADTGTHYSNSKRMNPSISLTALRIRNQPINNWIIE